MSLLQWNKFWRRKAVPQRSRQHSQAARLGCEPLESRRMLTLLGIVPQIPKFTYDSNGVTHYTATTEAFDITATPLSFRESLATPTRPVTNPSALDPRTVNLHVLIDNSGNLIGGTAGDDLVIYGNVDLDNNPLTLADNFSGVLLTGEVTGFGFLEVGATDQYDFRFTPTGGYLASYWSGKDIGITVTSEHSTFNNDFTVDFTGGAKGDIGVIDRLPGHIVVDKVTNPAGDPTSFNFSTTGAGYAGFGLTDADAPNDQLLAPGTYTVAELVPAGWALSNLTIVDPTGDSTSLDGTATLELAPGETIHVTFTDTQLGHIVVDKVTNPAGDPTSFSFSTTGTGYAGFGLTDADTPNDQALLPGIYTVAELVPAGWALASIVIVDPSGNSTSLGNTATLDLAAGETITITFTDTKLGHIVVDKVTNPSGDPTNFNFSTTGTGYTGFGLTDAAAPNDQALLPGSYTVAELVPAGWSLTGITIVDPSGNSSSLGSTATLDLSAGETIYVTYNDKKLGGSIGGTKYLDVTGNGLTVDDTPMAGVKIYLDSNNNGSWNTNEPYVITGPSGAYSFTDLSAGTYYVREVVPTGYVRTAPTLSDKYTVNLAAGGVSTGNNFANAEKCDESLCNVVYVINGTTYVSDLRGNTNEGDTVQVSFTVPAGQEPHRFTLVSYTAPGPTFVAAQAGLQQIFDIDTGVFGPGDYTLTVTIPHSFYQIDFVCGSAIDHFGPEGSNIFYSAQSRLISADNDGTHAVLTDGARLSGVVYIDANNNGMIDINERVSAGVLIKLTGTTTGGKSISQSALTDTDGMYLFDNLPAGTYCIQETQYVAYSDGADTIGSLGGTKKNDKFSGIVVGADDVGLNYNFGEKQVAGAAYTGNQTATIAYWNGSQGQALIKALNGSSSSKTLGNWLATNFNNMYGANAGSNNLAGKTNAQVASFYQGLFSTASKKLDAQTMALALSIYVTNSGLAGNVAASYGFAVSANGLGGSTVNVGTDGAAFGVDNNSVITALELLQRTNLRAKNGVLWNTTGDSSLSTAEKLMRDQAYELFNSINNT